MKTFKDFFDNKSINEAAKFKDGSDAADFIGEIEDMLKDPRLIQWAKHIDSDLNPKINIEKTIKDIANKYSKWLEEVDRA